MSDTIRHSLVSVAVGSHPLYPPLEVHLLGQEAGHVRLQLRRPGEQRCVEWVPSAEVLEDPYRLSDGLEAMLRSLCPQPASGRLP